MKWLLGFLPPWLNPTLLGAIALILASAGLAAYAAHKLDQIPLLASQKEAMAVQARYDGFRNGVVANAAKATSDAEAERKRLQTSSNDLQRQLIESQKVANEKSDQLRNILKNSKPGDTRPIGPSVQLYLDGVRNNSSGP